MGKGEYDCVKLVNLLSDGLYGTLSHPGANECLVTQNLVSYA